MHLLFLIVFLIPNIICHRDSHTIPLNYQSAINHLKQRQQTNYLDILDDASTYSITSDTISSYISLDSNNDTTQCEKDFQIILKGVSARDIWALKVIDAWGKPLPSGILKGNLYWLGNYDECLQPMYLPNNKSFATQPFDTQYCKHRDFSE